MPVRKTKMVAAARKKVMPRDQRRDINGTVICTTMWNIWKEKRHEVLTKPDSYSTRSSSESQARYNAKENTFVAFSSECCLTLSV